MPKKELLDDDHDERGLIEDYIDLSPSFDNSPIRSELDIKLVDDNDLSLEAIRRAQLPLLSARSGHRWGDTNKGVSLIANSTLDKGTIKNLLSLEKKKISSPVRAKWNKNHMLPTVSSQLKL